MLASELQLAVESLFKLRYMGCKEDPIDKIVETTANENVSICDNSLLDRRIYSSEGKPLHSLMVCFS